MREPRDLWTYVLGLFGAGNLVNGAWMLADPRSWYEKLPAAVPDYGPLNEHFVRDIGCVYGLMGAGLVVAAQKRRARVPVLWGAAGFAALHAAVHVLDSARGRVGPAHWLIDVFPIYFPAVVLGLALRSAIRAARTAAP